MSIGRRVTPSVPGRPPTVPATGNNVLVEGRDQTKGIDVDVEPGEPALQEQRSPDPGRWFMKRYGVSDRSS